VTVFPTVQQTHALARRVGLSHDQAVTATAIAMAESGLDPAAVGDVSLQDAKWGPSIGLWQIRSLKAQNGTGGVRDASRLRDPAFNARSMAAISSGGAHWSPWSTYNNGAYRAHLPTVHAAVGASSSPEAPTPGGFTPVGDWDVDPLPGGSGLPGYGDDLLGMGGKLNPFSGLAEDVERGLLWTAALVLGASLVVLGAWRAVS